MLFVCVATAVKGKLEKVVMTTAHGNKMTLESRLCWFPSKVLKRLVHIQLVHLFMQVIWFQTDPEDPLSRVAQIGTKSCHPIAATRVLGGKVIDGVIRGVVTIDIEVT